MKKFKAMTLLLGMSLLSSCSHDKPLAAKPTQEEAAQANIAAEESKAKGNITDPDISVFKHIVYVAGLNQIFDGTGPFTAFIPTNKAFDKLGKDKLDRLVKPENHDELVTLITFHIVPGKYLAENLKPRTYKSIHGNEVEVTIDGKDIRVNNAKLVKTDLVGPNGVIHEIDTVLLPVQ